MTIFRITPSTSVVTSLLGDHAFDSDSAAADQLIVDPSAFLVTTGRFGEAAHLAPTGAWSVAVSGTVVSDEYYGLVLEAGNAASSTITIGAEAEISGYLASIDLRSAATVVNHGLLGSSGNPGMGIAFHGAGSHTITNTGTIEATNAIYDWDGLSQEQVTNSGTIIGHVGLGGGDDTLTNSGLIIHPNFGGSLDMGSGNDKLVNTGTIDTNVNDALGGNDRVENSGLINGRMYLEGGNDTVINSGRIAGLQGANYALNLGVDDDVVTNFRIIDGVTVSGTVAGLINLGGGNDRFSGGTTAEVIQSGSGSDTIALGAGNDVYVATGNFGPDGADGNDTVNGGAGIDTYDASGASTSSVVVNLDTVAHDLSPFFPGSNLVDAGTAQGDAVAGTASDKITGFENAKGGVAADILYGSGVANVLEGYDGTDNLLGYGGNDRLDGGAWSDNLTGGAGRDVLTGGAGADYFHFTSTSHSGATATTRDLISDFEGGGQDVIALDRIDAVAGTTANDTFTFIGSNVAFTRHAGELRSYYSAAGQVVEGDVNGDGVADFSIALQDRSHDIGLTEADFAL